MMTSRYESLTNTTAGADHSTTRSSSATFVERKNGMMVQHSSLVVLYHVSSHPTSPRYTSSPMDASMHLHTHRPRILSPSLDPVLPVHPLPRFQRPQMSPVRHRLRIDQLQSMVAPLAGYRQQGVVRDREGRQRGQLDRRRRQSRHRCVAQSDLVTALLISRSGLYILSTAYGAYAVREFLGTE